MRITHLISTLLCLESLLTVLSLYSGMGTDENQLIQAIVLSSSDAQGQDCGGSLHVNGEWCVFASALQNDIQLQGETFPVESNQAVKIHCTLLFTIYHPPHVLTIPNRQIRRSLGQHDANSQCPRQNCQHFIHEIRQSDRLGHRRRSAKQIQGCGLRAFLRKYDHCPCCR